MYIKNQLVQWFPQSSGQFYSYCAHLCLPIVVTENSWSKAIVYFIHGETVTQRLSDLLQIKVIIYKHTGSPRRTSALNHPRTYENAFIWRGRYCFSFTVIELGTHLILIVSFLNLRSSALLPSPSLSKCTHMLPMFYIHITQKIKVFNSGST